MLTFLRNNIYFKILFVVLISSDFVDLRKNSDSVEETGKYNFYLFNKTSFVAF